MALSTSYYTEQGRTILFVSTLVVVAIVVVTLLRWISHLSTFGRMADVIDRVENAAGDALEMYAHSPTMGARPARPSHRPPCRWYPARSATSHTSTSPDSTVSHNHTICTCTFTRRPAASALQRVFTRALTAKRTQRSTMNGCSCAHLKSPTS